MRGDKIVYYAICVGCFFYQIIEGKCAGLKKTSSQNTVFSPRRLKSYSKAMVL